MFNRIGMASRGGPICPVRRATQPVDATPSSQLIRQHFPMENRFARLYSIRP